MNERWFYRPAAGAVPPRRRLICFPYAGGGPSMYRTWANALPEGVELVAIRLPGRESRFAEAPHTEWSRLIGAVTTALLPLLDLPFLVFGHSFGGMLAYEFTRELQSSGARLPDALLISGCRSSQLGASSIAAHDAPSYVLWQWVSDLDGTPGAVLSDTNIRGLIEPALRADLKLAQTWGGGSRVVDVPIITFGGSDDDIARRGEIESWRAFTARQYRHVEFAGGHFFVHSVESAVVAAISSLCLAA